MKLARPSLSVGLLLAAALVHSPARAAWDFVPTAAEWQSWPAYCRAQYASVDHEATFEVSTILPADVVDEWRRTVGQQTFIHLHHFCASIHFLNRARVEPDPQKRQFDLERARSDAMYTYIRADPQCMVYPAIAVTLAQVWVETGKPDEAEQFLQKSIQAQPRRPEPYLMLALLRRKAHKLAEARDILRQADEATDRRSVDIQYNLGLISAELGDFDDAVANAKKAYAKGYPLPGLKEKLRKVGHWSAADDSAVAASVAAGGDPSAVKP